MDVEWSAIRASVVNAIVHAWPVYKSIDGSWASISLLLQWNEITLYAKGRSQVWLWATTLSSHERLTRQHLTEQTIFSLRG